MSMNSTTNGIAKIMMLTSLATILMAILRMAGLLTWSWTAITAPVWITGVMFFLVMFIYIFCNVKKEKKDEIRSEKE